VAILVPRAKTEQLANKEFVARQEFKAQLVLKEIVDLEARLVNKELQEKVA
jgi:hypothetical protein